MTEAEYCDALDAWFVANKHGIRCANLHPSAWQGFHKQGLAPAVAGARIAASAPKGTTFPTPSPTAVGAAQGGGAQAGLPSASPIPVPPHQGAGYRDIANSRFVRTAGKVLFGVGLAQAFLFGLLTLGGFLLALAAYTQTVRPSDSSAARAGATAGFFTLMIPVGTMFGIAVTGLALATLGQLAIMAADYHQRHFGIP